MGKDLLAEIITDIGQGLDEEEELLFFGLFLKKGTFVATCLLFLFALVILVLVPVT